MSACSGWPYFLADCAAVLAPGGCVVANLWNGPPGSPAWTALVGRCNMMPVLEATGSSA